jgi:chromate transporter
MNEPTRDTKPHDVNAKNLRELAALFTRLGFTAFGGPVAHIAMMQDEVVQRRGWLTRQKFLDLVGVTNLIPGPNSTELAMHIGALRGGAAGLVVAGACFILPAVFIVMLLAALYVQYGTLPSAQGTMLGIQPVVVAVIGHALWKFLGAAIKNRWTAFIALAALGLMFIPRLGGYKLSEIAIIVLAAVVGSVAGILQRPSDSAGRGSNGSHQNEASDDKNVHTPDTAIADSPGTPPTTPPHKPSAAWLLLGAPAVSPTVAGIFWIFLKIGSILYGSGYVLIAFLRADFVERLGWLTDRQLLDAVAVGQFTPGPVFTTATFIGYQIAGVSGAIAATVGIFLPSFLFVGLLSPLLQRFDKSPVMRSFLDTVNAASFALMAAVTLELANGALVQTASLVWPILLFIGALICLFRTKLNSAWLIAAGAAVGLGHTYWAL